MQKNAAIGNRRIRRGRGVGAAALGMLAAIGLLLAAPVAAQTGAATVNQVAVALQNQLVVRADGAIFLIRDGMRHAVTPAHVSEDDLAAIPEGDAYSGGLMPVDAAPTVAEGAPDATLSPSGPLPSLISPAPFGSSSSTAAPPTAERPSTVHVSLNEWSIVPDSTTLAAGKVTFEVTDDGKQEHEMIVFKTDKDPAGLPTTRGRVNESTLGQKIGEIEGLHTGDQKSATYDLKPGTYMLLCNLSSHYSKGMVQQIDVR